VSDKPDIAIVGPGVVGTTLGILASRAGYRVVGVAGRSEDRSRASAEAIGAGVRVGTAGEIARSAGLVLLTVPDDAIERVCLQLAVEGAFAPGAVVAHCCGALPGDILAPARDRCGAAIGSMHPLQTFPDPADAVRSFAGTFCFCEGDPRAVAVLKRFAEDIGGQVVVMDSGGKLLYHASAVMAGNYLTALLDAALATAERAGIPRDRAAAALEPLVRAAVENVLAAGTAKALTGPIARGDEVLVARQFRAVSEADERLGGVYRALGAWTVELALRKGSINDAQAARLRGILTGRRP